MEPIRTENISGYYYAPANGYEDALHVRYYDGTCMCFATGPYLDESLAALVAAGVPEIPNPFEV